MMSKANMETEESFDTGMFNDVERISPEKKLEKNGAFVILYSDDFEGDRENKKVLTLMHWNNVFGFVGKELEDGETFYDALVVAAKEQIGLDLDSYKDKIEHMASYSYRGYGMHTYVCKIEAAQMKKLRSMAHDSETSVFNYAAIAVMNISPATVEHALNNNFGATAGMDLFEFVDKYISPEFEREMASRLPPVQSVDTEKELALEGAGMDMEPPKNKPVSSGINYSYTYTPKK